MDAETEWCWKYYHEIDRYKSFKCWPFNNNAKCNVKSLARAGFVWCGGHDGLDSVTCFLCGKTLDGWCASDDPWDEHLTHSPDCLYAKLRKRESKLAPNEIAQIKEIIGAKCNGSLSSKKRKTSTRMKVNETGDDGYAADATVPRNTDLVLYENAPTMSYGSVFQNDFLHIRSIIGNMNVKCDFVMKELEKRPKQFVCVNCDPNGDDGSRSNTTCATEIAALRQLVLKTNKTVNKHTVSVSGAGEFIDGKISEAVQPIVDRSATIVDFIRLLNECMSDMNEKVEFKDQLLRETIENAQFEKGRINTELEVMSDTIQKMNNQIHKLSAYIVQHQRRINEVQRESAKGLSNILLNDENDIEGTICDFMAELIVPINKEPSDSGARTIFCYIKKSGISEYALYQEFKKFGSVVRMTKMRKHKYGFISYSAESEASRALSKYNRDLFDCRVVNPKKQDVKLPKTRSDNTPDKPVESNATIVCRRKSTSDCINNIHAFNYFGIFGEVKEINFISKRKSAVIKYFSRKSAVTAMSSTHDEYVCEWGDNNKLSVSEHQRMSGHNIYNDEQPNNSSRNHSQRKMSHNVPQDMRSTINKQKDTSGINSELFKIAGYNNKNHRNSNQHNSNQLISNQHISNEHNRNQRNSNFQRDESNTGNKVVYCRSMKWVYEEEVRNHFEQFGIIDRIKFINNADYFFIYYSNGLGAKGATEYSHHVSPCGSHFDCFLARMSHAVNVHDAGSHSKGRLFRQSHRR